MEIMDVLHSLNPEKIQMSIIPMVLIPLTTVTVLLTSIAGIIAGWFGIKLNTEGPKQFLEVLLKKRVLISILIFNLLSFGFYRLYVYVKNMPKFIFTIERNLEKTKKSSGLTYSNSLLRIHHYKTSKLVSEPFTVTLKKEVSLPSGAFRSGAIIDNSIFFALDSGNIVELNLSDLKENRSFYLGTPTITRPIIYNNAIFTGEGTHDTHHARIYSYDLSTGKLKNHFQTKGHTEGQPQIGIFNNQALLFAPAGKDGLYALDPNTLKEVWHQNDGHLDATVSIENNFIYSGTGIEKGSLRERSYAIVYDFSTGKKIWKTELPLSNWMHPVVGKKEVCYALGEIYFPSNVGLLYCLDKTTGQSRYSIPFDAPLASKPVYLEIAGEEFVYLADFKGNACGVSLSKKEKIWCHKTGNDKTHYALSSFEFDPKRGVLWYPSLDNGLFAFSPLNGDVKYHYNKKWNKTYAAVSIKDDDLFLMDIKGVLRNFELK